MCTIITVAALRGAHGAMPPPKVLKVKNFLYNKQIVLSGYLCI